MMLALLSISPGYGWECMKYPNSGCDDTCVWASGSSLTYRVVVDPTLTGHVALDQWHEDVIEAAAENWRFGTGQRLTGSNWEFVRGADIGFLWLFNAVNEVAILENAAFDDWCPGTEGCVAPTYPLAPTCGRSGFDLLIREEAARGEANADVPWAEIYQTRESRDGDDDFTDYSLELVLTHEFGHMLGFDHDAVNASVMGGYGQSAMGKRMSISEHEYDAMTDVKPHSSTGNNLSLSKVMPTAVVEDAMFHAERWDQPRDFVHEEEFLEDAGYRLCQNDTVGEPAANLIDPIHLIHLGTNTLNDVLVRWRLRPAGETCIGPGSYLFGSRTVSTLNSGVPFSVLPSGNLAAPPGIAAGTYTLCAMVDPLDDVAETDEDDNTIESERVFQFEAATSYNCN